MQFSRQHYFHLVFSVPARTKNVETSEKSENVSEYCIGTFFLASSNNTFRLSLADAIGFDDIKLRMWKYTASNFLFYSFEKI